MGLGVIVMDVVRETDTEMLGVLETECVNVGVIEDEGGTPIVPAKL